MSPPTCCPASPHSSINHLLCRTGQKAEDTNVFNYRCQQWRSFLTNSRAMYSLVEVHQPANGAILSSNAFTWGLWLINWNLHTTGNLYHNSLLQARKMQCGSLKGAFCIAYWEKKKMNKGKTEVSGELWGDVSYGISHWSSSTALRRKPALLSWRAEGFGELEAGKAPQQELVRTLLWASDPKASPLTRSGRNWGQDLKFLSGFGQAETLHPWGFVCY